MPKIWFQTSLSHSVVRMSDIVNKKANGEVIIALKPSTRMRIVRIGAAVIRNLVMYFDRPNKQLLMCSRRMQ